MGPQAWSKSLHPRTSVVWFCSCHPAQVLGSPHRASGGSTHTSRQEGPRWASWASSCRACPDCICRHLLEPGFCDFWGTLHGQVCVGFGGLQVAAWVTSLHTSSASFLPCPHFCFWGGQAPLFQRWTETGLGWGCLCPEVPLSLLGTLHPRACLTGCSSSEPSPSNLLCSPPQWAFQGSQGPAWVSLRSLCQLLSFLLVLCLPSGSALGSGPQQAQDPSLKSLELGEGTCE